MMPASKKRSVSDVINQFILSVGHVISWANGLLIIVIVLQVFLRYGLGQGLVIFEELEWHLYALSFMFGFSYAHVMGAHVRVDLLFMRFSRRTQEWIDLLGIILLLMPFIIVVIVDGVDFFYESWVHNEGSDAPMGLCCRWAIKAVIPLSFAMFGLSAISRLIQAVNFLRKEENGSN